MQTGNAEYWIDKLKLSPHPEGGFFRETYRSNEIIHRAHLPARFNGDRSFSTAIYFLLRRGEFSAFHSIKQDELWHFYYGSPLLLHIIDPGSRYYTIKLGSNLEKGKIFQAVIPEGSWFGASTYSAEDIGTSPDFTLVGCTVAPGFDFADFTLAGRAELLRMFPDKADIIRELTR
ncbi:cupin domain-containing protein [bacterium]|nr:cupin domain-containing protein [bacterium]